MRINSETLKIFRKKRGFSQEALAEASGVAKKTIARIETGKGGETRPSTVQLLAKVLGLKDIQVLAQEPESEAVRDEELQKHDFLRPIKLILNGETSLACDLAAERYGIESYRIFNAAPMLFTLLAEMSLADRRRRASQIYETLETFPEHFINVGTRQLDEEHSSIAERDVFAYGIAHEKGYMRTFPNDYYFFEEGRNPFEDFLKRLAKDLGPENDAIDPEEVHLDPERLWDYVPLFDAHRKNLTGGSDRADYALSRGYVRIAQIPEGLRYKDDEDKDVAADRMKWLEAKVPDEVWAEEKRDLGEMEIVRSLKRSDLKGLEKRFSSSEGENEDAEEQT